MSELQFAINSGVKIKAIKLEDNEVAVSWMNGKCTEIISMQEAIQLGIIREVSLTAKEASVLNAIIENTFEFGLPVTTNTIKNHTGFSKRVISGVLSSLYSKGIVEDYGNEEKDEFILSQWVFEKGGI
ncbi:putative transcriptional regulator [Bacillus phage Bolokhovo]|uniref:Putative transcriptional regulator n=1 Tax=Bacillus phage Bolokhovo TaxID=2743970 RepID=A0A7D7PLD4_9CAUD|nr:putative transcriptional regulator [Bacillus phage Bolokhovo]